MPNILFKHSGQNHTRKQQKFEVIYHQDHLTPVQQTWSAYIPIYSVLSHSVPQAHITTRLENYFTYCK